MFNRQLVLLFALMLVGCATRPQAPPQDVVVPPPWGSIQREDTLQATPTAPGVDRAVLALAGTGSRSAYVAGLLCGWSEAGTRPRFRVVTGVSVTAIAAVFAFLGPEADDRLREFFTGHKTRDFYRRLGFISAGMAGSINARGPFIDLLNDIVDDDLLEAVAREHAAGRRLLVATTNLDANTLNIWDMGAIASSERDDRLERFRTILLASTSAPGLFPPVYFDVEVEGEQYWQMNVDGSLKAPVLINASMLDLVAGQGGSDAPQLFVMVGDTLSHNLPYTRPVRPSIRGMAAAHFRVMQATSRTGVLFRAYVVANETGLDFRLAAIPDDYKDAPLPEIFYPPRVQALFDFAYDLAVNGDPWVTHPPPSPAEPLE